MGEKASKPAPTITLGSFAQLRALAHPLRWRALELLTAEARTGKQLAELLEQPPTGLYHHLRVLEAAGLVEQTGTRKKRGTTEKYYRATAARVEIDDALLSDGGLADHGLFGEVLRATIAELSTIESGAGEILLNRLRIRTSRRRYAALVRGLKTWVRRFEEAAVEDGEDEYAVTVALYPTGGERRA